MGNYLDRPRAEVPQGSHEMFLIPVAMQARGNLPSSWANSSTPASSNSYLGPRDNIASGSFTEPTTGSRTYDPLLIRRACELSGRVHVDNQREMEQVRGIGIPQFA